MKMYFVTPEPHIDPDDGDYSCAYPEAFATLYHDEAITEATRLTRANAGAKFFVFEGKALQSFQCEPLPVVVSEL